MANEGWFAGVAAVMLAAVPLPAQDPGERAQLRSFRDTVATLGSALAAESVIATLRAERASDRTRLRIGFALLGADGGRTSRHHLSEAVDLFSRILHSKPDWPDAWYGLGLARANLAASDVVAGEGLLQPAGAGFAVGAVRALIRALELDPSFNDAAAALASHPGFDGWEIDAPSVMPTERLAVLRRVRLADSAPPDVWLGRAGLEAETGSLDSAAAYLATYLGAGGDQGSGWYRLARVRYRRGDAAAAMDAYYAGAENAATSRAIGLYRWNIAWVADSAELAAYDSLPSTARGAWLRRFWGKRDADAGRTEGERLLEHFRRYEYALEHFALNPSLQRRRAARGSATLEPGGLSESPRSGGVAGGGPGGPNSEWDAQTVAWLAGASSFFSRFVASQQLLDHRGVVYLRHGPPDQRAFGTGETWKYNVPPAPLVFHFAPEPWGIASAGSSGPTMLSALPGNLEPMCGLDTELCLLGMNLVTTTARTATQPRIGRPGAGPSRRPMRPTEARRQVERAEEWIARGTTTDTYTPRFSEPIEPVVQLYALHGAAGAPGGRILAVFAIDGAELSAEPAPDSSGRIAYPLAVRVIAFNSAGHRYELDTVRTFTTARPLRRGEHLLGQLELPLPPGEYMARVLIEEQGSPDEGRAAAPGKHPVVDAERGALVGLDGVRVPGQRQTLDISDVVLGRAESGLTWWSGRERLALNPLNTVPRGGAVQLYYELSGLVSGAEYRTHLAVYRRGDGRRRALLTLSFTETAGARWQSIVRALDLDRLGSGSYDLEVRIRRADGSGDMVARQVVLNVHRR